jgi:hypothetical protein
MIQQMLAWLDRAISDLFRLEYHINEPGTDGAARDEVYFIYAGPRYGIIRNNGSLEIGGYFQVQHRYNRLGKLLSRRLCRKSAKPGERLLSGNAAVYAMARQSPRSI